MTHFTLRLNAASTVSGEEAASSFYWLQDRRSSFSPGLGPSLSALGPVLELNVDFGRVALAVYAADRTSPRKSAGSDWNQRDLGLTVPVSNAELWQKHAKDLEGVIGFLSGDLWTLTFVEEQAPAEQSQLKGDAPNRVVLLSGGADSAIGALVSRSQLAAGEHQVLVSHFSANFMAPIQRAVAADALRLLPGPEQIHTVVHLGRVGKRIDGTRFPNEYSTRSRSLLFLALGLAAASVHGVPLWIPENGYASLNPPLGPERRGSLSTRTTHPAFLTGLQNVLSQIGVHATIENPFAAMTKGEMFTRAGELVGTDEAAAFLSATHSCGLTGQRAFGIPMKTACGVCFGCVVRRASFSSSGLADSTVYVDASTNPGVARWLEKSSVEQPARNLIDRGVSPRDAMALGLPPNYPIKDAVDLCVRGIDELRSLLG